MCGIFYFSILFAIGAVNSTQPLPQSTESIVQLPISVSHIVVLSPSTSLRAVNPWSTSVQRSGSNHSGGSDDRNNNDNQILMVWHGILFLTR